MKNHPKAEGLFHYWRNGNTSIEVNPDPPKPEEARPFHVAVLGKGYIPISYMVFARDEKHARSRVAQALAICAAEQYVSKDPYNPNEPHRAVQILADLEAKKLQMTVEAVDTDRICAQVNWASNGGL